MDSLKFELKIYKKYQNLKDRRKTIIELLSIKQSHLINNKICFQNGMIFYLDYAVQSGQKLVKKFL